MGNSRESAVLKEHGNQTQGHTGKTQQADKETPSHVTYIKAKIRIAGRQAAKPCHKAGPS